MVPESPFGVHVERCDQEWAPAFFAVVGYVCDLDVEWAFIRSLKRTARQAPAFRPQDTRALR